jgi:hypothetical protein
VALIQKLYTQALIFRAWNKFTFVVVDIKVLTGIDKSKIFNSLHNSVDTIFDIKYEWGRPVLANNIVYVGLCSSTYNHKPKL